MLMSEATQSENIIKAIRDECPDINPFHRVFDLLGAMAKADLVNAVCVRLGKNDRDMRLKVYDALREIEKDVK